MALNINGTTGISGVDGSASAPALQGTDSNTGINFGSDTVNINTGGVTRATVDSSGRLLIGTTTEGNISADDLTVAGSGNQGITVRSGTGGSGNLFFSDGTSGGDEYRGYLQYQHSTDKLAIGTNATTAITIDSSGKVGIGTTNPDRFFDVIKGAAYLARVQQTTNNQGDEYACFTLRHAGARSGQNGVGIIFQNDGGTTVGKIDFGQSSTQYRTSSDYRLKENAVSISDGITRLKTLKPYRFNFIAEPDRTVDGFFAHEVTAVPEAIGGTKDEVETTYYKNSDTIPEGKAVGDIKDTASPVYQGIDQSKLVPLLTAALQEAIAKIEVLETKVAALEVG